MFEAINWLHMLHRIFTSLMCRYLPQLKGLSQMDSNRAAPTNGQWNVTINHLRFGGGPRWGKAACAMDNVSNASCSFNSLDVCIEIMVPHAIGLLGRSSGCNLYNWLLTMAVKSPNFCYPTQLVVISPPTIVIPLSWWVFITAIGHHRWWYHVIFPLNPIQPLA